MKSLMLSHSDITGGAFIAAHRTHQAIVRQGIDSKLWVDQKNSDDWSVLTRSSRFKKLLTKTRPIIARSVAQTLFEDTESTLRSYNCIPSSWPKEINSSACDLVHLQWCNAETLSIKDISKIKRPIVQSLHDMWCFCGAEHYTESSRWKEGYTIENKPSTLTGVDIDRYIWKKKHKHWTSPRHLVAVSQWLADCVTSSSLLSEWPVSVIPNPIDTNLWKPIRKTIARELLNLPTDKAIVTFGAMGGAKNSRKGFTLLREALAILKAQRNDIHLVIFGQSAPEDTTNDMFPTTYLGKLHDPYTMIALNSAADVYVNPAIQEAFGQTASEAQACGLPVVAFNETGATDVVEHLLTGYLAQWKDPEDLARGIQWTLNENRIEQSSETSLIDSSSTISAHSRKRAIELFSYEVVGEQYKTLYQKVYQEY